MVQRSLAMLALIFSVTFSTVAWGATLDWPQFKSRFLMADGRIVDSGNKNISHTEGQGFGMLFALAANDRQSFDKIWSWTQTNLKNPKNGLFYWKFNPVASDPISDKNNASDGDTLIAWALLKAGEQWSVPAYSQASDEIMAALIKLTVVSYAGYRVMLPGYKDFQKADVVTLNPSYFVFPAWRDFARRTHQVVWQQLIKDGETLLGKMHFGQANLPTDWVTLDPRGQLSPAKAWPARVSYDAIRIPLYVKWAMPSSSLLTPWQTWWTRTPRDKTPAWVDVSNNQPSPYMMNGGLLAVRDWVMGDGNLAGAVQIVPQDDYYSASLKLLTALAQGGH